MNMTRATILALSLGWIAVLQASADETKYRLGIGDQVAVNVLGEAEFTGTFRVGSDGSIDYPYLRAIPVRGATTEELARTLTEKLKDGYLKDPQVTVSIKEFQSQKILIVGAVTKPGRYVLRVQWETVQREIPLDVPTGRILEQDVVLDAGFLTSAGAIEGSGARAEGVTWEVLSGDAAIATSCGAVPKFVLPAGSYRVRLTKGSAVAEKDFVLAAGDVLNLPLGLDAGKLLASAIYAAGGPKVTGGHAFEIPRPPAQEGEEGEVVTGSYDPEPSFDLPSGTYDVIVSLGRATATRRVDIRSGEPVPEALELGAGVVGLKAAKAEAIEIRAAEPDINGERAFVDGGYGETHEATLPAGDYLAVATHGDSKVEKRFSVAAGKRTEVVLAP